MICNECPRLCNALRTDLAGNGACAAPMHMVVAKAYLHKWEEPCLSGTKGSGTIFFSGCPLNCIFCQNHAISKTIQGKPLSPEELVEIMKTLEEKGAHNINLVTPSHYVHEIIKTLKIYKPKIPVVYNSSGYERVETISALKGLVDIYLPDMKYADDDLALRFSGITNYTNTAKAAIAAMLEQTGSPKFDENGMLLSGTMVRHLVLPGHVKNTFQVLRFLKTLPDILLSVMMQYTPCLKKSEYPELLRTVSKKEMERVVNFLLKNGLSSGYVQELESASNAFIPDFSVFS